MDIVRRLRGFFFLFFSSSLLFLFSCVNPPESDQVFYYNDFSKLDLIGFEYGKLFIFNGDTVSGFYHNEEVAVNFNELPPHDFVRITMDILIHDSWDGNQLNGISGPDYWFFGIDREEIFRTTFSNSPCVSTYCLYQSYPDVFPRQHVPKTGATQTNIKGLCLFGAFDNYTSRYSISKLIKHSKSNLRVFMNSELNSTNTPDPICDESWSLASLKIETILLK
jgi:hypothetical protein